MKKINNPYPKPTADLTAPIIDFNSILEDSFLDSVKMEKWLIKNESLYEKTLFFFYNEYRYKLDEGHITRLPCLTDKFEIFYEYLNLFRTLKEISFLHKKENYFKNELEHYYQISHSKKEAKEWVIKNEKIGCNFFSLECVDNYKTMDELGRIKITGLKGSDFTIYRNELIYSTKFFKLFMKLLFIERLYPESKTLIEIEKPVCVGSESEWDEFDREWGEKIKQSLKKIKKL